MCDENETCGESLLAQDQDIAMTTATYILIFQVYFWVGEIMTHFFFVLEKKEQKSLLI